MNDKEVKKLIKHPNLHVRRAAVEYFNKSYSLDEEVMSYVIETLKLYKNPYERNSVLSCCNNLVINKENFKEILSIRVPDINFKISQYQLILNSEVNLLEKYNRLVNKFIKEPAVKFNIATRIDMSKTCTEELIDILIDFSRQMDNKFINEFNYEYGIYIAKELSRRSDIDKKWLYDTLKEEKYTYLEIYLVYLAGETRDERFTSLLMERLGVEGDIINEEVTNALIKINPSRLIDLIREEFFKSSWEFKLYATSVMEGLRGEHVEEVIIDLLEKEKDISILTTLASALCLMFSKESINYVYPIVKGGRYDEKLLDLKKDLLINCLVNNVELKEKDKWLEEINKTEAHFRRVVEGFTSITKKKKIGRNDPCPCGSGKKYKKCCGR